jgi:hypothetical protein
LASSNRGRHDCSILDFAGILGEVIVTRRRDDEVAHDAVDGHKYCAHPECVARLRVSLAQRALGCNYRFDATLAKATVSVFHGGARWFLVALFALVDGTIHGRIEVLAEIRPFHLYD